MSPDRRVSGHLLGRELAPGSLGRRFETVSAGRPAIIELTPLRGEDEVVDRALRRIELLDQLDHAHLLRPLFFALDNDLLVLVTPAPDRTADVLTPSGSAARSVIVRAASAVKHLHDRGVLHRDIQPRHVGWYDGVIQLGGVGLADSPGAGRTERTGPIGGVLTMAPSIVCGRPATVGSDVYALGAMLHLLATGIAVHPVRTEPLAKRLVRIGSAPPVIDRRLPAELAPIVRTALAADGRNEPEVPLCELFSQTDRSLTERTNQ